MWAANSPPQRGNSHRQDEVARSCGPATRSVCPCNGPYAGQQDAASASAASTASVAKTIDTQVGGAGDGGASASRLSDPRFPDGQQPAAPVHDFLDAAEKELMDLHHLATKENHAGLSVLTLAMT
jgi:hypothetical protein